MTKQEKEIVRWIINRSWDNKVNPILIAATLAGLFPNDGEEINKILSRKENEN